MTKKIIVPIKGMHCTACELLTEEKLRDVPGVSSAKANHLTGQAVVEYSQQEPEPQQLKKAIKEAGYQYGTDDLGFFSSKVEDYYQFLIALIIFLALYWLISATGLLDLANGSTGAGMAWPAILLIGLTAGFSSCMALVGGLVLSVTANYATAHPDLNSSEKFRPHLYFNLGRIIGYAILGALLGSIGSVVHLSIGFSGWLIIIIALVMGLLGLKLVGIFPMLNRFDLALPKSVASWFDFSGRSKSSYSPSKTMVLGALTFFVPCGFTQAMQLYALSSANAVTGAITMALFAIGTAPGLLSLGGLIALVKGKWSQLFFRVAGITVVVFALFNFGNGWNLIKAGGFDLSSTKSSTKSVITNQEQGENGEQIIRMTQTSRGYSPKKFIVIVGKPVKWIIDSQNPNSCSASIVAPKIKVNQQLSAGENIIEFTPTEIGTINFTCSMGMYSGSIEVISDGVRSEAQPESMVKTAQASETDNQASSPVPTSAPVNQEQTTVSPEPTTTVTPVVKAPVASPVKVFKTNYTLENDIQPSEFRTKVGQATRIDVFAQDGGQGCMQDIMIQGLSNTPQYLEQGTTVSMSFTPSKAGRYLIVCAMNIPRGVVIVE